MKTGRNDKLNNKGFSLVELIVVIAIMMVVIGGVISWTGMLYTRAARQCAEQLTHEFGQVRIDTMGKGSVSMNLYVKADGSIWVRESAVKVPGIDPMRADGASAGARGEETETGEEKKVGSARCRVYLDAGKTRDDTVTDDDGKKLPRKALPLTVPQELSAD